MGPPSRSSAADAYDCIMVRIRFGSTEYKCVARCSAPHGELPSDQTYRRRDEERPVSLFIFAPDRPATGRRTARLAVHLRAGSPGDGTKNGPSRCSSSRRIARRRDEERPVSLFIFAPDRPATGRRTARLASEQRTVQQTKETAIRET